MLFWRSAERPRYAHGTPTFCILCFFVYSGRPSGPAGVAQERLCLSQLCLSCLCPPKDVLRNPPRNPHGTLTGEPGSPRPVLSDFQGSGRLPFMSCHCCPFAQQRRLHLAEKSSVETHKIDLVVQSLLGGPIWGRLQRMVACSWEKVKSLRNLKLLGVRGSPTASK